MVAGGKEAAVVGQQVALVRANHQDLLASLIGGRVVGIPQVGLWRRELTERVAGWKERIELGRIRLRLLVLGRLFSHGVPLG